MTDAAENDNIYENHKINLTNIIKQTSDMISRTLETQLRKYLKKFPIVTLTGVRQSGKSTLLRLCLKEYGYVSCEDPDVRNFAVSDPRAFLETYKAPCIFDEVQRAPELFSYLQTKVDNDNVMGEYVLSGSHNFLLMQSISQSLAGRAAILTLAPLSIPELEAAGSLPKSLEEMMITGFYPALYSREILPEEYFPSYVQTYIERDVRLLRNIPDADSFIRFVRLIATRSGQIINQTEVACACQISVPTFRAWLSILMQSYIVFELPPFYNNYSKRLVKSPKLYFYDTGLLCYLLGIESSDQLNDHPLRGAIFETMIVSEYMKSRYFAAKEPRGYYWRDTNNNEIDLLTEDSNGLRAYEIKSSRTADRGFMKNLYKFSQFSGLEKERLACIYAGDMTMRGEQGGFVRYNEAFNDI